MQQRLNLIPKHLYPNTMPWNPKVVKEEYIFKQMFLVQFFPSSKAPRTRKVNPHLSLCNKKNLGQKNGVLLIEIYDDVHVISATEVMFTFNTLS